MRDTIDFRNVSQELSRQAKELAREVDPEQAQPTQLTSQAFNPIKFKVRETARLCVKEGLVARLVWACSEARRAESFFPSFWGHHDA